ncbi:MAG TPA: PA domain-containing protein [Steroidobacteraceae bacterium]|nr:PA domain-containing protein [Steroidobacteraceae bacterium]
MKTSRTIQTLAAAGLLCWGASASAAKIEIINIDPPGEGFNDPTPATPVGGNTGTTLGAQRLQAYQRALDLWGSVLKSKVPIYVVGSFGPFEPSACDAAGGVLARAGAIQIFADFPNAPKTETWYGVALANALAGEDLAPGDLGPEADFAGADIVAQFNGGIGTPTCISNSTWYYGLDNDAPAGTIDFLNTFMHEVGHGLGFANFITETDGLPPVEDIPYPDIYMRNTLDTTLNKTWDQLTPQQITISAANTDHVVWAGKQVTKSAPKVLGPYQSLRITAPASLAKEIATGTASFGPAATAQNFNGEVALGTSGDGTTTACTAIASNVAGKIALVDRGGCAFVIKAAVAQAAGAKAVLVANTTAGVQGMSGDDPAVTIPALLISSTDGAAIKAALPGVTVEWFTDPSRIAGADSKNRVKLYAPATIALGSSISHFDTSAEPSLLMEPFITPDLEAATNVDLTAQLFKDIGWPIETLKIGKCDTRVPNVTPVGDIISTQIEQCAADTNKRGEFVACSAHVGLGLVFQKFIDIRDFSRIAVCAATVRNP